MPAIAKMQKELMPAVIYARYSSSGQQDQSIDGQLRDCYAFAEREGYQVIGEYIDRALSAKTDDRPDFQRMINDASKRQFQVVLVWKLDRFARNRYDSATYKARLKKHGVKVVSAMENISDNPEGIILEGMLESMAEYYSANLSQNIRRGQRESVLKGQFIGGRPPIGYKVENKRLVVDEEKAWIVRYFFDEYAKGVSKTEIVAALSAKGVKNTFGQKLTANYLQDTLRNKRYIGIYEYKGELVPDACPALIDEKTFNVVQEKLTAKARAPAALRDVNYLLSGKAYCGMCGTRLIGESGKSRSGAKHYYYTCSKHKRQKACCKKAEKKGFFEWYVVEQTVEYVLTPERIDYIAGRVVAAYNNDFSVTKIKEMEGRLMRIEGDVQRAVDMSLKAPEKAAQKYFDKIEELEAQKADIEIDLSRLKIAAGIRYTEEEIVAWLKTFCKGDLLDENFQRRIIDVFINTVYVYDDKVIIYYNIKDGKQISYIEMLESSEEPLDDGDHGGDHGGDPQGSGRFGFQGVSSRMRESNPHIVFM